MPIAPIPMHWPFDYRGVEFTTVARGPASFDHMIDIVDGQKATRQRPSFRDTGITSPDFGRPEGIFAFGNFAYCIIDETLYQLQGGATGATGGAWTLDTNSPGWGARQWFDVVNLNGNLYLIGGQTNSTALAQSDVWMSKDGGATWGLITSSAPFGARFGHRAVVFNGAIYVIGGWYVPGGGSLSVPANDVWRSEDGTNWTQINGGTSTFSPRAFFAAVATDGGIFVMGGCNVPSLTIGGTGTSYNDVWFSADGVQWAQVTTPNAAWSVRAGFDCVFYQGQLYLMGGVNANTLAKNNEVWSSPDGRVWTQRTAAAISGANFGVRLAVYQNKMWAIGGHTAVDLQSVYTSINGTAWTLVGNTLPIASYAGGIVVAPVSPSQSADQFESIYYVSGGTFASGPIYTTCYNMTLNITFTNAALTGATAGDAYSFDMFKQGNCMLIKSIHGLWVFEHGVVTRVTDARYPSITAPGMAVLGGFLYVVDPTGLLVNCDFNNPLYWPGANFIGADYEADGAVGMDKFKNYAVVFGPNSLQMFYDAGLAVGSPLLPYLAGNSKFGCIDGFSIRVIDDNLYWYGQDESGARGIATFDGIRPKIVSPRAINNLLNSAAGVVSGMPSTAHALSVSSPTRKFYVYPLESPVVPGSVVLDITNGEWSLWTPGRTPYNSNTVAFPFACACSVNPSSLSGSRQTCFMLSILSEFICYLDDDVTQDQIFSFLYPIPTTVQTANQFGDGSTRMKAWGRLDLVSDQTIGDPDGTNTIEISVSDDDYQSYVSPRNFETSSLRPAAFRWGSSRRRAYQLIWNAGSVVRVMKLLQEYTSELQNEASR